MGFIHSFLAVLTLESLAEPPRSRAGWPPWQGADLPRLCCPEHINHYGTITVTVLSVLLLPAGSSSLCGRARWEDTVGKAAGTCISDRCVFIRTDDSSIPVSNPVVV